MEAKDTTWRAVIDAEVLEVKFKIISIQFQCETNNRHRIIMNRYYYIYVGSSPPFYRA